MPAFHDYDTARQPASSFLKCCSSALLNSKSIRRLLSFGGAHQRPICIFMIPCSSTDSTTMFLYLSGSFFGCRACFALNSHSAAANHLRIAVFPCRDRQNEYHQTSLLQKRHLLIGNPVVRLPSSARSCLSFAVRSRSNANSSSSDKFCVSLRSIKTYGSLHLCWMHPFTH